MYAWTLWLRLGYSQPLLKISWPMQASLGLGQWTFRNCKWSLQPKTPLLEQLSRRVERRGSCNDFIFLGLLAKQEEHDNGWPHFRIYRGCQMLTNTAHPDIWAHEVGVLGLNLGFQKCTVSFLSQNYWICDLWNWDSMSSLGYSTILTTGLVIHGHGKPVSP